MKVCPFDLMVPQTSGCELIYGCHNCISWNSSRNTLEMFGGRIQSTEQPNSLPYKHIMGRISNQAFINHNLATLSNTCSYLRPASLPLSQRLLLYVD